MKNECVPAIWFLAVRSGSGTDVFTERLVAKLLERDIHAEIEWLPHRAEYAPWTVPIPRAPAWANVVHISTWLHRRFLPKGLPVVATLHHAIHGPALRPYKGYVRAAYHRCWMLPNERRTMRRADKIIAVSKFAEFEARKSLVDRPMRVIYNGIDVDSFRPFGRFEMHRPFRLLYVGKWTRLKGVDLLAPIMRELGDGFELRYTGGTAMEKSQQQFPRNMRDLGRLQGPSAVLAAMWEVDALLFPSRSEGFGLVAAEAMSCGLPVIATSGSSLTEVVQDGLTGLLCEQEDVSAFASAARQLAKDVDGYAIMSRNARDYSVANFSLERAIDEYCLVYQECLAVSSQEVSQAKKRDT